MRVARNKSESLRNEGLRRSLSRAKPQTEHWYVAGAIARPSGTTTAYIRGHRRKHLSSLSVWINFLALSSAASLAPAKWRSLCQTSRDTKTRTNSRFNEDAKGRP